MGPRNRRVPDNNYESGAQIGEEAASCEFLFNFLKGRLVS